MGTRGILFARTRRNEIADGSHRTNLRVIRDDRNDLDELESQTARIVANLRAIQEDDHDIDELERQSDKIMRNLRSIEQP